MANSKKNTIEKDWKRKYFDSLKELETSEKSWGKLEELLRLGISRLTLIADSSDNEKLGDQIALLRKSIRDGTDSKRLVLLIENISEDIRKLPEAVDQESNKSKQSKKIAVDANSSDKSTKSNKSDQTEITELLTTILDLITFKENQQSQVSKFQRTLNTKKKQNDKQLTENFSNLISELIEHEPEQQQHKTIPEITIPDSAEERRKDNRVADNLDSEIDRTTEAKKNSLVAPAVGELFLQLMSRFPPSFSKRLSDKNHFILFRF